MLLLRKDNHATRYSLLQKKNNHLLTISGAQTTTMFAFWVVTLVGQYSQYKHHVHAHAATFVKQHLSLLLVQNASTVITTQSCAQTLVYQHSRFNATRLTTPVKRSHVANTKQSFNMFISFMQTGTITALYNIAYKTWVVNTYICNVTDDCDSIAF